MHIAKTIAALLALISLAGILFSLCALSAGALGTGFLYFSPKTDQPTQQLITPPPTSTPRSASTRTLTPTPHKKQRTSTALPTVTSTSTPVPSTSTPGASATNLPPTPTSATATTAAAFTPTLVNPTTGFSPTPSRTPLPSATTSPLASATQTLSSPVFIDFVSLTTAVTRGNYAVIEVKTLPAQICSISYHMPDGEEMVSQELSPVMSGSDGICTWEWFIFDDLSLGIGIIQVSVGQVSNTYTIQIIE